MTERLFMVNVRAAPNLDAWRPPVAPPTHSPRLADRVALVIVASALLSAIPEIFGLAACLEIVGRSVLGGVIIVPDDLPRAVRANLLRWAKRHPLDTISGPRPWSVLTLSEFFEPYSGLFARRAYSGASWCIGADLGRVFGLAAEHWGGRHGPNVDSWVVWLPGWGRQHADGRWMRRTPHRPPLWMTARRVGWQVEFAPCGKDQAGQPAGKRVGGRVWRGAFIDVMSLAYALDADRGASFAEHCANFGLDAIELPLAVTPDAAGAARMTEAVTAVHALVFALDAEAAR